MKKTVPYITGDGVGAEITPAMQAIVNAAVKKAYGNEHEIEWISVCFINSCKYILSFNYTI